MTVFKSSVDTNKYYSFSLPNGLRILSISDPEADKGGCALSVGVGSYDEPRDIQGLAHFLEHMLFMGTKEYPRENEYMDFLSQHNGTSNAYTANENTVYYFDVGLSHFEEALKMFSSFFKTPLFLKESVDREISAVHSEFLNGKCNDTWRVFRMYQLCCKEDLPESQFNVGNNKTLRIENIHKIVKDFWESKYSSEKMCVVLYSNVEKDTFKKYSELFKDIPNTIKNYSNKISLEGLNLRRCTQKDLLPLLLENYDQHTPKDLFKEEYTNRIIHVEPVKDQKTLIISVVVPPEYKYIRINPYSYIEYFFLREDEKGLVGRIKDKGLGFYADFDLESHKEYSLLQITIGLTKKGENQVETILGIVEDYFKDFEYSEEEYLKLKDLKALQFTYKEMDDPIDCVESVAEVMQYVPIMNVFNYSYILYKWNKNLLKYIVSYIGDRTKWLIFLLKKDLEFDLEDELYGIKYKIT